MSVLEVKKLSKTYFNDKIKIDVLKQIDLSIDEGEFVIITGPSGSGKTTLLNCISGLEKTSSGTVYIDGVNLVSISEKEMAKLRRHKIGFVLQNFNLLPNLNVYENVAIASIIAGNEQKDKIEELLEKFNLIEFKKMFPNQLSGGMQQRVAIVRALINDPEIIFADEPTGNLDSSSSLEVIETLQKLHKDYGKTIIMVTHSLEQIKYGTRHIQIIDGKIINDTKQYDE
jgi:putative ABC transport system ATP-binding protein